MLLRWGDVVLRWVRCLTLGIALESMGEAADDRLQSRCVRPRVAKLEWRDYFDPINDKVVEIDQWLNELSDFDRELAEAEIADLREQAALGRIPRPFGESLKRMREGQFVMLELRWCLAYGSGRPRKLRQYHVEPARLPTVLVALHKHLLVTHRGKAGLSSEEQWELQNVEVRKAFFRYAVGEHADWT